MKLTVIIPFYNKWHLTHARMSDLYRFLPPEDEIVVINDNSQEIDCEAGIAWWQKKANRHKIYYKRNKKNLGFGGSMNEGAKIAIRHDADILLFLSNDVAIYGDIFSQIKQMLAEKPKSLLGGEIIYWPAGWNEFEHNGKKFSIPWCNGWLLACTKEIWLSMDGFDPMYGKFDYEDVDLSTQALSLGYNLLALNSPLVKHLGGQTINNLQIDRIKKTRDNREKFIQKWAARLPEIYTRLEQQL